MAKKFTDEMITDKVKFSDRGRGERSEGTSREYCTTYFINEHNCSVAIYQSLAKRSIVI